MSPLNFTHILTQAVDELSESSSYKGLFHQHTDGTPLPSARARTCMNVVGIANSKIENFILRNVCIEGNKAGKIIWAKDWKLDDVQIKAHDELILEYNENVDMP